MAELSWGVKRTCNGCGARFYDLRKSPATCPKCGATCELQTIRGKRERASAKEVVLPLDDFDLALVDSADPVVVDPALLEEEEDPGFGDLPADLDTDDH